MDEERTLGQRSKTKTVPWGPGVHYGQGLIALFLLIISCNDAWAGSYRQRLQLVGYAREEISDIMSGRRTLGQCDLELGLRMQGYDKEEIRDMVSARDMDPGGHRLWQQTPDRESRKGLLIEEVRPYFPVVKKAAARNNVDMNLVLAIIKVESAYDHRAVSPKGAKGLMQLMPHTAGALGVTDPFDPRQNVHGGTRYLSHCMKTFNNIELALAAYNAGPTLVARLNKVPAITETQHFVRDVLDYKKVYDQLIRED
ncbi:MAG: lytic transglycosylase domain-containing protein [Thermodesulfobacteriota bacterium]|nr:lytic transglycosylase domain-containing protein [Thermodesulfobacteriota bacterium]